MCHDCAIIIRPCPLLHCHVEGMPAWKHCVFTVAIRLLFDNNSHKQSKWQGYENFIENI